MHKSIVISGSINNKMVRKVMKQLCKASSDGATIIINSEGGCEACGRAIAGFIKVARDNGIKVDTVGMGNIHSAAVLIFAAGATRELSQFAQVFVHETSVKTKGSTSEVYKLAAQLAREEQQWCSALEALTGTPADTWRKLHTAETYLTPAEALKLGLATEVV